MILFIIGLIIISGILNPWTGIFSIKHEKVEEEPEKIIEHKSFRITKNI